MKKSQMRLRSLTNILSFKTIGIWEDFLFPADGTNPWREPTFPKNILQPIIENSILHGICPKADPGNICLEINRREENVEIIIADDGVGMDHERLESLFNFKKDETVKTPKLRHIGLNNVAQRLEFIFPGKHQFRIESQPGLGTKIVIIHPVVTTPDYPNSKGVERN